MEMSFQNNNQQASHLALNDYPSDRLPAPKRPKLWGMKSERTAKHEEYCSAPQPCIGLSFENGHRSSKTVRPSSTAHCRRESSSRSQRVDVADDFIRNTSADMSREILSVYRRYTRHTASEKGNRKPTTARGGAADCCDADVSAAAAGATSRGSAATTRSCDMVCQGGTCRMLTRPKSTTGQQVGAYDCRKPMVDVRRESAVGVPHANLTSSGGRCCGSTCEVKRQLVAVDKAGDLYATGGDGWMARPQSLQAWTNNNFQTDNDAMSYSVQSAVGGGGVECVGGQCHLKPRSLRHSVPIVDHVTVDSCPHHQQARSRPWAGENDYGDDAPTERRLWRSTGTDIEYFLQHQTSSPTLQSRPLVSVESLSTSATDDDRRWTVLADLSRTNADDGRGEAATDESRAFSDMSSGRADRDAATTSFGGGWTPSGGAYTPQHSADYDQVVRRHGWRFEIPGDPYCLKRSYVPERPIYYSTSNLTESGSTTEPGLVGHHWGRSDTYFHNARPPRPTREYIVHPEFATERLCSIDESTADSQLELMRRRHLDAAKMMHQHQKYQQSEVLRQEPRYVKNNMPY